MWKVQKKISEGKWDCAQKMKSEPKQKRKGQEQRGLETPGNKGSKASIGVLYPPSASHPANRAERGYRAKTWKYAGK